MGPRSERECADSRRRVKLTEANLLQGGNPRCHVAQVEGIVEARHLLASHLRDLEHLCQLFLVAREEIKEREPVEVLCLLVGNLDDLTVTRAGNR